MTVGVPSDAGPRLSTALDRAGLPLLDQKGAKVPEYYRRRALRQQAVIELLRQEQGRPAAPKAPQILVQINPAKLPSAARAGRSARTVCGVLALLAMITAFSVEGNVWGAVAASLLHKLVHVAVGGGA